VRKEKPREALPLNASPSMRRTRVVRDHAPVADTASKTAQYGIRPQHRLLGIMLHLRDHRAAIVHCRGERRCARG
jgi:hypothetical protein